MNKIRILLVALVLAAQIVGIFCVSSARERELADAPTFRLECASYDPRDILRGHYLPLDLAALHGIPASKFDASAREYLVARHADSLRKLFSDTAVYQDLYDDCVWFVLAPNAGTGFWELESVGFDDPKIVFTGKPGGEKVAFRTSCENRGYIEIFRPKNARAPQTFEEIFNPAFGVTLSGARFRLENARFFLSEEKAKRFDAELRGNAARKISAEFFLRADGTPVPKRLFVDGEPF